MECLEDRNLLSVSVLQAALPPHDMPAADFQEGTHSTVALQFQVVGQNLTPILSSQRTTSEGLEGARADTSYRIVAAATAEVYISHLSALDISVQVFAGLVPNPPPAPVAISHPAVESASNPTDPLPQPAPEPGLGAAANSDPDALIHHLLHLDIVVQVQPGP